MATQEAIQRFKDVRNSLLSEREEANKKLNAWLDTTRDMDVFRSLVNEWSVAHVNFKRYDALLRKLGHIH
ncbi:hypothetical protein EVB79_002 [Rhizobium phage RHph_N3_13]|nr:hypothetical protein EVB79_002 [Rhizobium phage RHph_N3_13]